MNKIIPRHSLIIAVGPNDTARNRLLASTFSPHEIVSVDDTTVSLIGRHDEQRVSGVVFPEMRRRTELKLSLGERVVVNASNLKRDDRLSFAKIAVDMGVPVFYMLADPEGAPAAALSLWKATQRDLYRGDGVAEVVDLRCPVTVIGRQNPTDRDIMDRFDGVTIIADVHGMQQSLYTAVDWARARRNYIVFLGDIIDYGPQTLEVADHVYALVMRGEAELMLGNHERKIARWVKHQDKGYSPVNLSEGNKVTTQALAALSHKAKAHWIGRFTGLVNHAHYIRQIGKFTLAHASIHPRFWDGSASRKELETSALFGEFEAPLGSTAFVPRTYDWVDAIPGNRTVVVGHDIRRKEAPLVVSNAVGGQAVFLDTGCGKGGRLSSVDIRWEDGNEPRLTNFNMY